MIDVDTTQMNAGDMLFEASAARLAETSPQLRKPMITENQLKVIRDKYLRDDPSLEVWLWRIAENLALSELLYDPLVPREDVLAGVSNSLEKVETGDSRGSELLLLHASMSDHNSRMANHRRFIANLYKLAREHPHAKAVVREWAQRFYELMVAWDFLPNSPCLMNAGRSLQQLSACYVLPIEDTIEGWGETTKNTMIIHQSGGGTGFSAARVRHRGDIVKSTKGIASGALSPLILINQATGLVKQGGTRRGANMGILPWWHPDIIEFMDSKQEEGKMENFNISVALDGRFMAAAEADGEVDLVSPRNGQPVRKARAKELFEKIINNAWRTGDPGVIFLDRVNDSMSNPTPAVGQIESTNPCGEQPLLPYESCNLGSINLRNFVSGSDFDWPRLRSVVRLAARMMDNCIDVNNFPLSQIEAITKGNRRLGMGVMGWAESLAAMGIPYDSESALSKAEQVAKFIDDAALSASEEMASERGVFPNFIGSVYDPAGPYRKEWAAGRPRNCARTTIAPTGTIAIAAGLQGGGIEPFFALVYTRYNAKALDALKKGERPDEGDVFYEVNPVFRRVADASGFWGLSESELWKKVVENHGSVRGLSEVPEGVQRAFATAHDISVPWHVRMQAAWQKYTNNAVSKTINMPNSATPEDVRDTYLLAWKTGCKGITVYRDGCKSQQVLNLAARKIEPKIEMVEQTIKPRPRPKSMQGMTQEVRTGCGDMYITVNRDEKGPFELFAAIGKSGGCISSYSEAVARLISLALRSGIEPRQIVKQLKGIRCSRPVFDTGGVTYSCADCIAKAFEKVMAGDNSQQSQLAVFADDTPQHKEGGPEKGMTLDGRAVTPVQEPDQMEQLIKAGQRPECPECGGPVNFVEGCVTCSSCGYSACG